MVKLFPISPVFLLALLLLVSSCANIVRPTGGPKDTLPPQLVPEKSTSNLQTNFRKQKIELTFDEWLKLDNPSTQVVVTPPPDYKFTVSLSKKSVFFEFDEREVLKDNATYTINFGEAVKDLNEGNIVPDLRFVFSTGPYIDSLEVSGLVVDAVSGEPQADVLVMLYDNLADSVFRTTRPFYFSKSDKEGKFSIRNIRADTFKVCALKNDNLNYLYDQNSEEIGFLKDPVIVADSLSPQLKINLFKEEEPLRLVDTDNDIFGLLKLIFNQEPRNLDVSWSGQQQRPGHIESEKDSLKIWYPPRDSSPWKVYLRMDSSFTDTVLVKGPGRRNRSILRDSFRLLNAPAGPAISHNPNDPIRLKFNHPVEKLDSSRIVLSSDSLQTPLPFELMIDSSSKKVVLLKHPWKEDSTYSLQILPGGITDFFGMVNDRLEASYKILVRSAVYGSMQLELTQFDSNQIYILQLLNKGSNLVDEKTVGGDTLATINYPSLLSGQYSVRIIEDRNQNGRWDTGVYDLLLQPERQMTKKLEELRADWEVNAEIKVAESLPSY